MAGLKRKERIKEQGRQEILEPAKASMTEINKTIETLFLHGIVKAT